MDIHGESPIIIPFSPPGRHFRLARGWWMARIALPAIGVSVALMVVIGFLGPSVAVATFPAAPPMPPWFIHANIAPVPAAMITWMAVLVGGVGLASGLAAVRRGWRPPPRLPIPGRRWR